MLLLSAAASVNSAIGGLGPFDTPFESPGIAHDNQLLAANAPAPEPLPGPLRQLLLRGPGTGRPAGQPAGCPSDRSTYRMMPPCPAAGTIFRPCPTRSAASDVPDRDRLPRWSPGLGAAGAAVTGRRVSVRAAWR